MSYIIDTKTGNSQVFQGLTVLMQPFNLDDEAKILQNAADKNTYIANLKDDLAAKGHDVLTIVDYLDIDKMVELSDGTNEAMQAIQLAIQTYAQAKAFHMIGIRTNWNDMINATKAAIRGYEVGREVITRLYEEFKTMISTNLEGSDDGFEEVLFKSAKEICSEFLGWNKYCAIHGIEFNPEKPDVPVEMEEEYNDWVDGEIDLALEALYKKPSSTYFPAPIGLKALQDKLREVSPIQDREYADTVDMNLIIDQHGPQKAAEVIGKWKLPQEVYQEISELWKYAFRSNILAILNPSSTPEEAQDGNHDTPFFASVTLPEILYNILCTVSGEIRDSKAEEGKLPELSFGSQYIVDLVRQVIEELILNTEDEVKVTESFAYSYLSLFRMFIPEHVSKSALVRYSTSTWALGTQATHILMKLNDNEPIPNGVYGTVPQTETEEGDKDGDK